MNHLDKLAQDILIEYEEMEFDTDDDVEIEPAHKITVKADVTTEGGIKFWLTVKAWHTVRFNGVEHELEIETNLTDTVEQICDELRLALDRAIDRLRPSTFGNDDWKRDASEDMKMIEGER